MGKIECCHYCKAPKRHCGCHDKCAEYAKEKEKLAEEKKARQREMDVLNYNYDRNAKEKLRYMKIRRHLRDMSERD